MHGTSLPTRRDEWFIGIAKYDGVFQLGATRDEVAKAWDATIADLRRAPGGQVGPHEFISVTFGSMYSESDWIGLAQAISDFVVKGDDTVLIEQAAPAIAPEVENQTASCNAVTCVDAPWPKDLAVWERDAAEQHAKYPFAARYNQLLNGGCATWPVGSETRVTPLGKGLPPILMFAKSATRPRRTPVPSGCIRRCPPRAW
ncbi:hypothetical protein [Nonomuraea sp. B19D2]|uniref:hypothetical protein n=1 Tax=Nonomuraea sp. B19D2 TaxID=3159561 RepID=UPI0032DBA63B